MMLPALPVPATMTAPTPVAFDYSAETPADAKALQELGSKLRAADAKEIEVIVAIGGYLLAAKQHIKHGSFSDWVAVECGYELRTAENYMSVARRFGSREKAKPVSHLRPTTVYKLAAKSTPESVLEEIVKRYEAGEKLKDAEIVDKLKAAKSAIKPKPIAPTPPAAPAPAIVGAPALVIPPDDEIAAEGFIRKLHAMAGVEFGTMMDLLDRAGGVSPAIRKAHSNLTAAFAPAVSPVAPMAALACDETPSVEEIETALGDDSGEAGAPPATAGAEASDERETIEASAPAVTVEPAIATEEKTDLEIKREHDALARESQLEAMLKGRHARFPRTGSSKPAPAESATTEVDDDAIDPEHVAALYGVEPEDAEVIMATMEEAPPATEAETRDMEDEEDGKQEDDEIEELELDESRAAA